MTFQQVVSILINIRVNRRFNVFDTCVLDFISVTLLLYLNLRHRCKFLGHMSPKSKNQGVRISGGSRISQTR